MPVFAHHYHIVTLPLPVLLSPRCLDGREALRFVTQKPSWKRITRAIFEFMITSTSLTNTPRSRRQLQTWMTMCSRFNERNADMNRGFQYTGLGTRDKLSASHAFQCVMETQRTGLVSVCRCLSMLLFESLLFASSHFVVYFWKIPGVASEMASYKS